MIISKNFIKKICLSLPNFILHKKDKLSSGVYCFNYHRIGDADQSDYDSGVFSCDQFHFEHHIKLLKNKFEIINIHRLVEIITNDEAVTKPLALITFDDGYIDNYSLAFPILKKLNTPAVFFLPTSYIDSNKTPWWDEIAWLINNSNNNEFSFENIKFNLDQSKKKLSIKKILSLVKNRQSISMEDSINEISELTGCSLNSKENRERLFMTWAHAKEMIAGGMNIGSHTVSHSILAYLSEEDQFKELSNSKKIIEDKMGEKIDSFAYPVGGANTYTAETKKALEKSGYIVGFNFVPGINKDIRNNRFEINRFSVDNNHLPIDHLH